MDAKQFSEPADLRGYFQATAQGFSEAWVFVGK